MLSKKYLLFFALLFTSFIVLSQDANEYKDYKDAEQFKKFSQRRKIVGAWQIHQLKEGALVVKLKTNQLLIQALLKKGDKKTAEKKRLEALAVNLNLCRAFRSKYNFSKIYFINSNSYDSLLKGARSNIFLDTNLIIDSSITMAESFFILSEAGNVYNSSIGFVPEDSAKTTIEHGSETLTKVPVVLKNKYGHQLKRPLPFYCGSGVKFISHEPTVLISINGLPVPFFVTGGSNVGTDKSEYMYEGEPLFLEIPKSFTYKWLSISIANLNEMLDKYYKKTPIPDDKKIESVKAFLY